MHENPLPQCDMLRKAIEEHLSESKPVRLLVQKHEDQILTLNKAVDSSMSDIKEIKETLFDIEKKVDRSNNEIKIWILTMAVSSLVALLGVATYYGGDKQQLKDNTRRLDRIESRFQSSIKISNDTE